MTLRYLGPWDPWTLGDGLVWFGMVRFGLVWFGLVWFGLVWFGVAWHGMVWYLRGGRLSDDN